MKVRFFLVLFVMSLCLAAWPAQGMASPTDDVKKVVDEVIRIVTNKELKKPQNEKKRRDELRKTIASLFDFKQMAKLSLGPQWRKCSPAEQKVFVPLFESLLENSYASRIEAYNNEKVVYLKESVEKDYAEVKSKVITVKGDELLLVYRLGKDGDKWMVHDVVIEGVSLVANYRSQFNRVIQTQGYAALEKKLQSKSTELKSL